MKRKAKFPTGPARKREALTEAELKKIAAGILRAERVVVGELQRRGEDQRSSDYRDLR